jgi:hypothetical protein
MAKTKLQKIEKVLGIFIILLLVAFGIMVFQTWRTQAPARPIPSVAQQLTTNSPIATSVWYGQTAKEAYQLADTTATNWAKDAQFVAATATLPPGTNISEGYATWTLTYYSPIKHSNILISVADTHASIISEKSVEGEVPLTNNKSWSIDSPQVIQTLLGNGGDAFVTANPDATLVLTLSNNPFPYWEVVFFATESGNVFTIKLDATNGEQI